MKQSLSYFWVLLAEQVGQNFTSFKYNKKLECDGHILSVQKSFEFFSFSSFSKYSLCINSNNSKIVSIGSPNFPLGYVPNL